MSMMKYNFGEISALADSLTQQGHSLITQTDHLDQAVKQLSSTFTGNAYEAYQQKMAAWKSEMTDSQQILAKIAGAVRSGGEHMQQTDSHNASALGG